MPAVEDTKVLSRMLLFEGLSEVELKRLNSELLHRKVFTPGTNIITVAQPGEVVYILLEGSVKIYVDQLDGSEVILAFLGPGDTFGEMGIIGSGGRSASVLTLEPCTVLAMDRKTRLARRLVERIAELYADRAPNRDSSQDHAEHSA